MADDQIIDVQKYCNCMVEVRDRIGVVERVMNGFTIGHQAFDAELVFIQLRMALEIMAFASLIANREKYSATHEKFASHWNAERILRDLEKVNPQFYPVPVNAPEKQPDGIKHCSAVTEGFLTKEDFVRLYDKCGKILHARNPFSTDGPRIALGYSVKQWVSRIQTLLRLHITHLVNGDVWVIQLPAEGNVMGWPASARTV
jgi:hypothetical protein